MAILVEGHGHAVPRRLADDVGREERDVRPGGDNSVRSCRPYSRAKIGPGTSAGEFSMALSLQGELGSLGVLAGWPGGPLWGPQDPLMS